MASISSTESDTGVRGGRRAPAAVPGEDAPLDEQEEEVEAVTEEADQHDRRPHRGELEGVLRVQQDVADAVRGREVLGDTMMITASERLVRMPAAIWGIAAGRTSRRIRSRLGTLKERAVSSSRRVDRPHPVHRVQEYREEAEERDERHLLDVADGVQKDDRDREKRRRRHRPPVLDVRHREGRVQRDMPSGTPMPTPTTVAMANPRTIRLRLGTTCVPNSEKSQSFWNSTRIVESRGKFGSAACTVQSCHAARIAIGTAISAAILSVLYVLALTRLPFGTGASAGSAARAPRARSGSRSRGTRSRARARTPAR